MSRITVNDEWRGEERQENLCRDFAERLICSEALPIACRAIEGSPEVVMTTRSSVVIVGRRGVRREIFCLFMGMFWWGEQASRMGVPARMFHGEAGQ